MSLIRILKQVFTFFFGEHFQKNGNGVCLRYGFGHHGAQLNMMRGGVFGDNERAGVYVIGNECAAACNAGKQPFV